MAKILLLKGDRCLVHLQLLRHVKINVQLILLLKSLVNFRLILREIRLILRGRLWSTCIWTQWDGYRHLFLHHFYVWPWSLSYLAWCNLRPFVKLRVGRWGTPKNNLISWFARALPWEYLLLDNTSFEHNLITVYVSITEQWRCSQNFKLFWAIALIHRDRPSLRKLRKLQLRHFNITFYNIKFS